MALYNLLIFVYAAILLFPMETTADTPNRTTREINTAKEIDIELLIVCDKEFSDYFQHDRQRIIDYWAMQIWDTNLRYKSLRMVNISFRVSQLIIINKTSEQPFIENSRNNNGSVSLYTAMQKFSEWLKSQKNILKEFHIAILVTGAQKLEKAVQYWAYGVGVACKEDFLENRFNSFVMHFDSPWGNRCALLSEALGLILGAPFDHDTEDSMGCNNGKYLQSKACGKNQYFFSKCSDAAISKYVQSNDGKCVRAVNDPSDIIATQAKATHPPSLDEQCVQLTGNTNVVAAKEKIRCIMAKCMISTNGTLKFSGTLYPLENSPCDNNKFCFRGRCLPRSYELFNLGLGKCLHAGNRFSSNDFPILAECVNRPTPLDKFLIMENEGVDSIFLATPYSTPDASENSDKCLSLDLNSQNLQYDKCSSGDVQRLGWNFVKLNETGCEFFIYHVYTNTCLSVRYEDGKVMANQTCDETDKTQRWIFNEQFEAPGKWFKEIVGSRILAEPKSQVNTSNNVIIISGVPESIEQNQTAVIPPSTENQNEHLIFLVWSMTCISLIIGIFLGMLLFYVRHRLRKSGSCDKNNSYVKYTKESGSLDPNINNYFDYN